MCILIKTVSQVSDVAHGPLVLKVFLLLCQNISVFTFRKKKHVDLFYVNRTKGDGACL